MWACGVFVPPPPAHALSNPHPWRRAAAHRGYEGRRRLPVGVTLLFTLPPPHSPPRPRPTPTCQGVVCAELCRPGLGGVLPVSALQVVCPPPSAAPPRHPPGRRALAHPAGSAKRAVFAHRWLPAARTSASRLCPLSAQPAHAMPCSHLRLWARLPCRRATPHGGGGYGASRLARCTGCAAQALLPALCEAAVRLAACLVCMPAHGSLEARPCLNEVLTWAVLHVRGSRARLHGVRM